MAKGNKIRPQKKLAMGQSLKGAMSTVRMSPAKKKAKKKSSKGMSYKY